MKLTIRQTPTTSQPSAAGPVRARPSVPQTAPIVSATGDTVGPLPDITPPVPTIDPLIPPDIQATHALAVELMRRDQLQPAIDMLLSVVDRDSSARSHGLLGAAYYRQEKYDLATEHLQTAVDRDPQDVELNELLHQSANNNLAQVQDDVFKNPFDPNVVLGVPRPGTSTIGPVTAPPPTSLLGRAARDAAVLGRGVVSVAEHVTGGIIGNLFGLAHQALGQPDKREVWTTWSRKNYVMGLLQLAHMRYQLNKNNLYDSYPKGALTGFVQPGLIQPEWTKWARTADGTWNNAINPKEGAAGTRFGQNVKIEATWPDIKNIMSPNPRELSTELLTRVDGKMKEVPFLNLLAAAWIQFMVHDWVSHGDNDTTQLWEIPLPKNDRLRVSKHMTHMFVPKTTADPTRQPGENGPPTYLNEVTHWWDGSQIYGSDLQTQMKLRSGVDGKLKVGANGNIPVGKDGIEETGFRRNWWLGLSLLHNVFVREHNAICDMLKKKYPQMSDQELFDKARLINAAVMAKIHTIEWTPAILPNGMLHAGMLDNWYGAATKWLHQPENRHIVKWFDIKQEAIGGIVGGDIDKHNVAYSLTELFVSVYRLHSLLPDWIRLRKIGDENGGVEVPLGQTRAKAAHRITNSMALHDLLDSFGTQHPGQLVLNNFPKTLQDIAVPGFASMDLGAIDILRDRERGVPRYNEVRRQLGLNPIRRFEDLTDDKEALEKLKRLYKNDIEQIDLLVGTLAEAHRPEYFGFGETMFQVFILNASRRLQADRFFTTSYNAETYTQEGLDWIDRASMKGVLLRHCPKLAETGLANVDNAFEPWDKGWLDPERHPLRRYRQ